MRKELITDAVLVKNYMSGDESALSVLINRHKQRIFSFIYSKVFDRDVAEDIFQDAISHNLVIDHFRKTNRMPKFDNSGDFNIFSVLGDPTLNAEKQIIKEQVECDLRRLIQELPEDQKEVLVMRMYRDMSFKEISERTGVSINTALGRMRYALINLRKVTGQNNIVLTN